LSEQNYAKRTQGSKIVFPVRLIMDAGIASETIGVGESIGITEG